MADGVCTIGKGTTVRGSLTGGEDLAIAGRLEGSVVLTGHLLVEAGGVVVAGIEAQRLTVRGVVQGDVNAIEAVTVASGATLLGTVRAPRLELQEGARFRGRVEMDVNLPAELRR